MRTNVRTSTGWGIAAVMSIVLGLAAQSQAQTVLIDLGSNESFRGLSVTNPDNNGNHWTSVWSGAYYPDIKDIQGNATDIDFGFSSATGTDSYNGPAGPTDILPPSVAVFNTDVDTAALGLLGGSLAAPFDFYTTSRFEIQGLDPTKTYNLTFFGSHKFSDDPTTAYSVYTDNTYSSLVASTTLNVMDPLSPWLHNRDTVATLTNLSPQTSNILYVSFYGANGGLGYLNSLMITATPEPTSGVLLLAGLAALCASKRRR